MGLVTINRPKSLNALNVELIKELNSSLELLEKDNSVGCILLFGHEKFFSVGADIKEMVNKEFIDLCFEDLFVGWNGVLSLWELNCFCEVEWSAFVVRIELCFEVSFMGWDGALLLWELQGFLDQQKIRRACVHQYRPFAVCLGSYDSRLSQRMLETDLMTADFIQ